MTPTVNRDDLIQTLRPLDGWEILARGVKALEVNDLESASYIYDYLTTRKRERFAKYFKTMIVNEFNTYPIEFLTLAHEIAKKYESRTKGTHKVYVILLDGYLKGGRYGLYVGQTSRTVGNRLIQHLVGGELAAKCHKKMRILLPSLYAHLAPMRKKESLEIEEALANEFRAVGIRTEGGKKSPRCRAAGSPDDPAAH